MFFGQKMRLSVVSMHMSVVTKGIHCREIQKESLESRIKILQIKAGVLLESPTTES